MIIDCVSDLHGELPVLDGGDLLIIAGDITASDKVIQWKQFYDWLKKQNYRKKIYIAGNHDGFLENCTSTSELRQLYSDSGNDRDLKPDEFEYLKDSGCEFEGLKIWGSPWTPEFYDWHFMKKRGKEIRAMWDKIPEDTDILVTHGPPYGILDKNKWGDHCGCEELRIAVERIKPSLHVFGHIHGGYGKETSLWTDGKVVSFVNASLMDDDYEFTNKPTRIML